MHKTDPPARKEDLQKQLGTLPAETQIRIKKLSQQLGEALRDQKKAKKPLALH